MDLLREPRACSRRAACVPDGLVGDGLVGTALTRGAGKEISTRLLPAPPATQFFEQLRRERHIPVSGALALADVDDHALAVDVFDLDARRFGPAYSGHIEQRQNHAVQAVGCGIDQPHDFILAEHGRQLVWHLREDEIVEGQITPLQRALVQEPQRRDTHLDGAGLELLLLQQVSLITSQVLSAQLLRRAMEVFGKLSHRAEVAADRRR